MSSWYRPVDAGLWGDEKFRRLSGPQPCAKYLWLYLLTGDHTNGLPGLFRLGEAALAESLDWPLGDLRCAFEELAAAGMVRSDQDARVVYLPNALKYQAPINPSHLQGWSKPFGRIPECALRRAWLSQLTHLAHTRGRNYVEALRAGFGVISDAMVGTMSGTVLDTVDDMVADIVLNTDPGAVPVTAPGVVGPTNPNPQLHPQPKEGVSPTLFELNPEYTADDEVPFAEIVGYLNDRTGKRYRHASDVTRRHIRARWREGYRLPEFKTVIDTKCAKWQRTEREVYLRPETLFGPKFEGYVNEQSTTQQQSDGDYADLD